MKTLVRTIALITVISLGSVCFCQGSEKTIDKVREKTAMLLAKAQRAKEKVNEKVEKAELENALRALQEQKINLDKNQEEVRRQLAEIEMQRAEILETAPTVPVPAMEKMRGLLLSSGRVGQSTDISVVITSEDEQPESIAQLTEDMGIMARIFDKQVLEIPVPKQRGMGFGDMNLYMYTGARQQNRTRGIYITDFGALFQMEVDFPLKPEPDEDDEDMEEKAEVPDIWERTKSELKGWYQGPSPEPEIKRVRRKAAFDESKVEELKEKIIKSLKYASNMDDADTDYDIIVSVTSKVPRGSEARRDIRILNRYVGGQTRGGGGGGGYGGGAGYGLGFAGGFAEEPSPITGMTIIVNKGDVDEFAEGEMDYEEFLENVEIFEY
jgi:hypothetical protein